MLQVLAVWTRIIRGMENDSDIFNETGDEVNKSIIVNICDSIDKRPLQTNTSLITNFTTNNKNECWEFCKYTLLCSFFAFDMANYFCLLYNGDLDGWQVVEMVEEKNWITATRYCYGELIEPLQCINQTDIPTNGHISVYLRVSFTSRNCVAVVKHTTTNYSYYNLETRKCSPDQKWSLSLVNGSSNEVQISNKNTSTCLVWNQNKTEEGLQYLSVEAEPCLSAANTNSRFVFETYWDTTELCKVYLALSATDSPDIKSRRVYFSFRESFAWNTVLLDLMPPHAMELPKLCKDTMIPNGKIKDAKPFYLPEELIEIQCNHGFGVKKKHQSSGYVWRIKIRCTDGFSFPKCIQIPMGKTLERSTKDNNMVYLVIVYSSALLSSCFVLSGIFKGCVARYKIAQLRNNGMEMEGGTRSEISTNITSTVLMPENENTDL